MAVCQISGCGVRATAAAQAARPCRVVSARRVAIMTPSVSRSPVLVRAEGRSSDSSFVSGFVLGGVVFGALGFIFAPQISKAILGDDARLKLPRFLENESPKDPEATKQDLIEKIAQLNASIDEVAASLKTKESTTSVAVEEAVKVA